MEYKELLLAFEQQIQLVSESIYNGSETYLEQIQVLIQTVSVLIDQAFQLNVSEGEIIIDMDQLLERFKQIGRAHV